MARASRSTKDGPRPVEGLKAIQEAGRQARAARGRRSKDAGEEGRGPDAAGSKTTAARPATAVTQPNGRAALDEFLKEIGFATSGDLVLLEPERSETREVRRSEKAVVATISTRARDRHGDIVDPVGVRLERFRKNPVVLWAHDYEGLPIARSLWERVRVRDNPCLPAGKASGRGGCELVAKPQFHLDTELSREVWALLEKGVLSAWSVGFIPEQWEPIAARGGGGGVQSAGGTSGGAGTTGFVIRKWDLIEYSCVPVPANFEALTHELKVRRITAPALVKSLAPLGLRAPDLVPVVCTAEESRDATEVTEGTELPPSVDSVSSVAAPGAAGATGRRERKAVRRSELPGLARRVVAKAFERAIRRARGEGV